MSAVITELIGYLVSGITAIGQGIGGGLQDLAKAIFLTGAGTTESPYALSVMGALIASFAAISLGFSLTRWVLNFCTSFGNRNR